MTQRISYQQFHALCPRIREHLLALGKVSDESGITPAIRHLVKLRVSQLNHCCFCQHMHSQQARNDGEQQRRLDVLPAWREAPCFTRQERAALAWAEALTLIGVEAVADAVYRDALSAFGEPGLVELTTVVLEINSWNRLAVAMQFVPEMGS